MCISLLLASCDTVDNRVLPFVEFRDGWRSGQPPENNYRYGFLLGSHGKTFRVRCFDMHVLALEVAAPGWSR